MKRIVLGLSLLVAVALANIAVAKDSVTLEQAIKAAPQTKQAATTLQGIGVAPVMKAVIFTGNILDDSMFAQAKATPTKEVPTAVLQIIDAVTKTFPAMKGKMWYAGDALVVMISSDAYTTDQVFVTVTSYRAVNNEHFASEQHVLASNDIAPVATLVLEEWCIVTHPAIASWTPQVSYLGLPHMTVKLHEPQTTAAIVPRTTLISTAAK